MSALSGYNFSNDISQGGEAVLIKEAVEKRILALCDERGIAINELANIAGVPPSTVYSMLNTKSQNPGIVTLKIMCDGAGITLTDFFNTPEFLELEQELDLVRTILPADVCKYIRRRSSVIIIYI